MDGFSGHDQSSGFMNSQQASHGMFGDYGGDDYGNYYNDGDGGGDDGGDGGGDANDAKRRRIARACDMCRKKKIKCDGKMPACSHCINYKTECIFTQVEKKRNPPKGAKYIEGLENRLGRMESLLKLSGLLGDDDDKNDLGTLEKRLAEQAKQADKANATVERTPPRSDTASDGISKEDTISDKRRSSVDLATKSPKQVPKKEEDVGELSDMMCSLVTNNCGEARYIGSSSGFSIFSPKGIQWVNEKTGDESFQSMMSESATEDSNKWVYWKPEIFGDIFTRRIFRPLPPLSETLSLLKDYFENFNCIFPLFHEPTFMHLVRRQYSRDPYTGSGWWASLNCALAIAHRLRVMSNLVPQEEDQKAWGHLKNALGVMAELTMRNTDLLSVQALLGMALFLQGTPNPQPSFLLVASALRLAHSIGLHKKGSGFNLSPVEVEQRKRVFWIAYILDKDMCLRSGRPPAQDDDDMNVELPTEDPSDNIGNIPLADGKGKTNLFRLMCKFAIIESRVYSRLYSTKATKQSDGELLNTIGELDKELEEWKEDIPLEFRPEQEIKIAHTPLVLHVVVLHFSYYNCLTTIHRMSVHHGYWTSRLSNYAIQGLNARPLNPRVFSSSALCVQAARASIQLIRYIPQGDYACVWMIIYFPVTALVTLFANVLQNPQDARARSDIRLMHQVVSFLSVLAVDEETGGVKRMLDVCVEFERIAKIVVDKSDQDSHSRRKRKAKDEDDHIPRPAPSQLSSKSIKINSKANTPKANPSNNSTGNTPNFSNDNNIQTKVSPSMQTIDGAPGRSLANGNQSQPPHSAHSANSNTFSSPASNTTTLPNANNTPDVSGLLDTIGAGGEVGMLDFVPRPGDFPNPYTEPTELNNFGMNFQQPYMQQDMWNQVPMNFDWDWTNMQGGAEQGVQGFGAHQAQQDNMGMPQQQGGVRDRSSSRQG